MLNYFEMLDECRSNHHTKEFDVILIHYIKPGLKTGFVDDLGKCIPDVS